MPITKSQLAAPRSARSEARGFTYDKGRTLLLDKVVEPNKVFTKNYHALTLRSQAGLSSTVRHNGLNAGYALSVERGKLKSQPSTIGLRFNNASFVSSTLGGGASESAIRKLCLAYDLQSSNLYSIPLETNTRISPQKSAQITAGNAIGLLTNTDANSMGVTNVIYQNGSTPSAVSFGDTITSWTGRNRNSVSSKRIGSSVSNSTPQIFLPAIPVPTQGIGGVSGTVLSRQADYFRIILPLLNGFRGSIIRSGISWQQIKNDEAFLRTLKYRNP